MTDHHEAVSADAALDDSTIGVALSGGGVRAALFCAGALRAIVRHAEFKDKQLAVSGVSGSALLAFETAWSSSPTDEEALEEAIERIVKYGYWLGRRWWAVAVAVLISVSIAFPIVQDSGSSAMGLLITIGITAAIAVLLAIGLFRTQGIFYRARPVSWHPLPIYAARPSQFGRAPARRLTLDHVVLNATSLNDGSYVSFDRMTFPTDVPVSRLAEASAAFLGSSSRDACPDASKRLRTAASTTTPGSRTSDEPTDAPSSSSRSTQGYRVSRPPVRRTHSCSQSSGAHHRPRGS
ncbi:hypothetical protein ACFQ3F_24890 [Nocardioides ginsengisoli]|uniref:PNPLA domain-containing protein n=1 Tax=Nocardioides ginsengisoli TaxID=363868 RepID=A0ABW3W6X3_9ACTN